MATIPSLSALNAIPPELLNASGSNRPIILMMPPGTQQQPLQADAFQLQQPGQTQAQRGTYGIQNHGVQSYLPIQDKRAVTTQESAEIEKGLKRWWPKLYASYATPLPEMLASPAKSGLLGGIMMGLLGGILGAAGRNLAFVLLGLLGGGVLGSVTGYLGRQKRNEDVLDLMKRLPEGATKRDMESDPVYQAELNRRAMAASGSTAGDFTSALLTAGLTSSMFNNSSRRSYGGYRPSTRISRR